MHSSYVLYENKSFASSGPGHYPARRKEYNAMVTSAVEERAFANFQCGFNCAEAIARAVGELFSEEECRLLTRVATGFGGGVGRSHDELCGTFAGGVLALGFLFGKTKPDESPEDVHTAVTEFRKRFLEEFDSTQCGALLNAFGEQENLMKCKRMTGRAAGLLVEIICRRRKPVDEVRTLAPESSGETAREGVNLCMGSCRRE